MNKKEELERNINNQLQIIQIFEKQKEEFDQQLKTLENYRKLKEDFTYDATTVGIGLMVSGILIAIRLIADGPQLDVISSSVAMSALILTIFSKSIANSINLSKQIKQIPKEEIEELEEKETKLQELSKFFEKNIEAYTKTLTMLTKELEKEQAKKENEQSNRKDNYEIYMKEFLEEQIDYPNIHLETTEIDKNQVKTLTKRFRQI